jgi:hypothetical protein
LATRCQLALIDFSDARILTDSRGSRVSHAAILAAWSQALKKVSLYLKAVLLLVVITTVGQWITVCFLPLKQNKIGDHAIDWGTFVIDHSEKADWWATMFFTAVAYTYMGVALFIYLAILMYAAAFAVFLDHLSDHSGQFRLVIASQPMESRNHIVEPHVCYQCIARLPLIKHASIIWTIFGPVTGGGVWIFNLIMKRLREGLSKLIR